MKSQNRFYYTEKFKSGEITVEEENSYITAIYFGEYRADSFGWENLDAQNKKTEIIRRTFIQLDEYFCGKRKLFDIPFKVYGTDFQKRVWNELTNIPYGETRSYSDIACAIGSSKAVRAVGNANNKNRIMIIIPCHRVIGKNGNLVGYAGGIDKKKSLLELEKVFK